MSYYYNRFSDDSNLSQYSKYLQNQNYVSQITQTIRDTGSKHTAALQVQTNEIKNATVVSSNSIRVALENGFSEMNNYLGSISDGIDSLIDAVGVGFSQMIEEQRISNLYLDKIVNLLRIPDKQKERVYHIEEGLKYLTNAFKRSTNDLYYKDALEEFQKSLDIEKRDFFSLYYIGYIHLYSTIELNAATAEQKFRDAARYYQAEAAIGGTNFSKNLLPNTVNFKLNAAQSLLHAAWACYLQEKTSDAFLLAKESWETEPEFNAAGFMYAKYACIEYRISECTNSLSKIIAHNPKFFYDAKADINLGTNDEVVTFLNNIEQKKIDNAFEVYTSCIQIAIDDSAGTWYLSEIKRFLDKHEYTSALKAHQLLTSVEDWTFNAEIYSLDKFNNVFRRESTYSYRGTVAQFLRYEKDKKIQFPTTQVQNKVDELEGLKEIVSNGKNGLVKSTNRIIKNVILTYGIAIFIVGALCIIPLPDSLESYRENIPVPLIILLCIVALMVIFYFVIITSSSRKLISDKSKEITSLEKKISELKEIMPK